MCGARRGAAAVRRPADPAERHRRPTCPLRRLTDSGPASQPAGRPAPVGSRLQRPLGSRLDQLSVQSGVALHLARAAAGVRGAAANSSVRRQLAVYLFSDWRCRDTLTEARRQADSATIEKYQTMV